MVNGQKVTEIEFDELNSGVVASDRLRILYEMSKIYFQGPSLVIGCLGDDGEGAGGEEAGAISDELLGLLDLEVGDVGDRDLDGQLIIEELDGDIFLKQLWLENDVLHLVGGLDGDDVGERLLLEDHGEDALHGSEVREIADQGRVLRSGARGLCLEEAKDG